MLYSTLANGMPILNSSPLSTAQIYLDFNAEGINVQVY